MKIGILSDTHDYLDPRLEKLFTGVDFLLHGGDVGMQQIILELGFIAPVTAVLGNTDMGNPLKLTEVVTLAGRKFLLHHIVNPRSPDDKLRALLARHQPDVVIFGHTHQAFDETIGGIRFFNPGYAGKPKLGVNRSVAVLHCDENHLRAEYLPL